MQFASMKKSDGAILRCEISLDLGIVFSDMLGHFLPVFFQDNNLSALNLHHGGCHAARIDDLFNQLNVVFG